MCHPSHFQLKFLNTAVNLTLSLSMPMLSNNMKLTFKIQLCHSHIAFKGIPIPSPGIID